jgi:hypothetical protein
MGTFDELRAAFGDMAIRSVHHNVGRLDWARAFRKSQDWPPNVVSIAEAGGAAAEAATSWPSGQR